MGEQPPFPLNPQLLKGFPPALIPVLNHHRESVGLEQPSLCPLVGDGAGQAAYPGWRVRVRLGVFRSTKQDAV